MSTRSGLVLGLLLVGCGSGTVTPKLIAGFNPAPVAAGYTRYVLPAVHNIPPGGNQLWCQYIAGPSLKTQDIVYTSGEQTKGGHHIVVYATKVSLPVGTSRPCETADQLSLAILGGIGGEGVAGLFMDMPAGVTFRLPAGYGIMANTHYINTTTADIDGQGVVDMKFEDPSPDRQPLNMLVNVSTDLDIPSNSLSTKDVMCPVGADQQSIMFFNHMHEWGSSIYTEVIHADGSAPTMLRADQPWVTEFTFNPTMTVFGLSGENMMMLHAGDTIHTHCEWNNTTSNLINFPTEMCVGVNMILGDREIDCVDGQWDADN